MRTLFQILKENKVSTAFAATLVCIPLLFSGTIATYTYLFEAQLQLLPWWGWALFYLITIVTMGLALTPTTFIAILGGYFLSWISLVYMIPAYLLASLLCYTISQRVDRGKLMSSFAQHPKVQSFLSQAHQNELSLVIYSKLSPALPFALSNFLLAVMNISRGKFLLGCLIGMLPRTLLAIWTGKEMNNFIHGHHQGNQFSIIIVLLLISIWGLFRVFRSPKTQA